jgi:hypothetical protein
MTRVSQCPISLDSEHPVVMNAFGRDVKLQLRVRDIPGLRRSELVIEITGLVLAVASPRLNGNHRYPIYSYYTQFASLMNSKWFVE